MAQAGVFREDDRLELLVGEIVEMTPIGSRGVCDLVQASDDGNFHSLQRRGQPFGDCTRFAGTTSRFLDPASAIGSIH